ANGTIQGFPYVRVIRQGGYDYNLTIGAGVTLVIWDNDNSFINAVKRIIDFFHKFRNLERLGEFENQDFINSREFQELIREGVELITWFLIHINDIFTGEELFALNPITWQSLDIRPWNTNDGDSANYSISKELYQTGGDYDIGGAVPDNIISNPTMIADWNATASARSDDYVKWLLTPTNDADLVRTLWTTFTFDLIQLWVKNFEIHIDVGEIMNLISGGGSGTVNIASIFQGLDIEFYLFTHHLAGAFLYDDSIVPDNKITTEYVRVNQSDGVTPVLVNGEEVHIPKTSEVTHRIILNSVNQFNFIKPQVSGDTIKWGIRLVDTKITPVPVGVDLDNYLGADQENLGYIQFGFTFEPKKVQIPDANGREVPVLQGAIKLYQEFAPWNDPITPSHNHSANNPITGLDMAIIYLSSMLHFHLNVQTIGEDPDDPTTFLDPSQDYNDQTHELRIGNYLGDKFSGQLGFIDIAGPSYEYGDEDNRVTAPASTAIIPLALYESEIERHDTFVDEDDNIEFQTFATDIQLNISFNVLGYAVCYPEFENGNGIWHDPTFTVYMVFEATGFWALILLIAGVGLVGVATVLIKRRKDARF
ncbi:MAG: hypothetical protein ACFE85_01270, partial [Candidatus Hodarchaeota archaeon]